MAGSTVLGAIAPIESEEVDPSIQNEIERLLLDDPEFADDKAAIEGRAADEGAADPKRVHKVERPREDDEDPEVEDLDEEPEEDPDEDPDGETDEDEEVRTVADLAKSWGMEESEVLEQLNVSGPDGTEVSLSDVVAQFNGSGEAPAVAERIVVLDQERNEERLLHGTRVRELMAATDALLNQVESQHKLSPEQWDQLERDDPGEWAMLREKERQHREAVTQSVQQLDAAENQRLQGIEDARNTTLMSSRLVLQQAANLHGQPDWNDQAVAEATLKDIEEELTGEAIGFSMEDLGEFVDARYMKTAYYAMKYLQTLKGGKRAVKKAQQRKVPRFANRTARREQSRSGAKKRTGLFARAKESGDVRDAAAVIEAQLAESGMPE